MGWKRALSTPTQTADEAALTMTHFPPSKRVHDGRQASCWSAVKVPETKPVPAVSAVEK